MLQAGADAFLLLSILPAARNSFPGLPLQDGLAVLVFLSALAGEDANLRDGCVARATCNDDKFVMSSSLSTIITQ